MSASSPVDDGVTKLIPFFYFIFIMKTPNPKEKHIKLEPIVESNHIKIEPVVKVKHIKLEPINPGTPRTIRM